MWDTLGYMLFSAVVIIVTARIKFPVSIVKKGSFAKFLKIIAPSFSPDYCLSMLLKFVQVRDSPIPPVPHEVGAWLERYEVSNR